MCRRLVGISTVLVLLLVVGCQVDVLVDVQVHEDGSGQVVVGVGLDDEALARVGDLGAQLRTEDLVAAGWTVSGPSKEGDTTWVRASKPFSDPAGASAVITEVAGVDGPFRGFLVERSEGLLGTDYSVTGTINLTGGPATFSDADLAALLGGDPFGGTLDAIVSEEGRPLSEMVGVQVRVELPGSDPQVTTASFADQAPVAVDVSSSQQSALARVAMWLVVGAIVLAVVAAVVVFVVGPRRRTRR